MRYDIHLTKRSLEASKYDETHYSKPGPGTFAHLMWVGDRIQAYFSTDGDKPSSDISSSQCNCNDHECTDRNKHNCPYIHSQSHSLRTG